MKSHGNHVLAVYASVLEDAARAWPDAGVFADGKDLSYLRRAFEQRGMGFFTLTLPAFGKVLDRALDQGCLHYDGFPKGIPTIGSRPELFRELLDKVFDRDSGVLHLDACPNAVFFLRQLCYGFKKFRLDCKPSATKATIDAFYATEASLPPPNEGTFNEDDPTWIPRRGHPLWGDQGRDIFGVCEDDLELEFGDLRSWDSFRILCARVLGDFGELPTWDLECRHGPGAVSETKGWVSKYDFPHWSKRLDSVFPYDWYATGDFNPPEDGWIDWELPSRLLAVPKTQKGPRLICAEPISHQWIQQGIWRWLRGRVDASPFLGKCIDFRSQENSRKRALLASMDGRHATIDLSEASDRLTCRLVEYVFQSNQTLLDGLHASRTQFVEQTLTTKQPRLHRLRKFSSMGSACTFPVQSIVFSLIAIWAVLLKRRQEKMLTAEAIASACGEVTVFGDDIIVPVDCYDVLCKVLHALALKVNTDKSYGGSNFRESCGMFAFRGYDVSTAYILEALDGTSPSSVATTVETANNLHKCGLWKTAETVVNQLEEADRKKLLVVGEDGGFGLYSFCGRSVAHLKQRWDRGLQMDYYKVLSITAKVEKAQGRGRSGFVQYCTEQPSPDLPWESGQPGRAVLRKGTARVYG